MDAIETSHCDAHLETDVIIELDIIQDPDSLNTVLKGNNNNQSYYYFINPIFFVQS